MFKSLFLILFLTIYYPIHSQPIEGKWKTFDEETGNEKSIIELKLKNDRLYGYVIKVFPKPGETDNPICDHCPGIRKGKQVLGMEVISGLEKEGNEWKMDNGILDPENGKLYDCKIWIEDKNKLAVRGYIGFFYRTQFWNKVY